MFKMVKEFLDYKKRSKLNEIEEPYFHVKSNKIVNGQLELDLEWNDAFIKLLQKNNYKGINESDMVDEYLFRVFESAHSKNFLDQNLLNSSNDE